MPSMFPIRHSWIFRSRWVALLWAAGIIWFALDMAGSPPPAKSEKHARAETDALGQQVDPEQARRLLRRLEH